jgi:stage V sporulation protein G
MKAIDLELDLVRVVRNPSPLFKYQLVYRDGRATGLAPVYSFDEDWYYLYKNDSERYRVKRCKDLEGNPPEFTYEAQRRVREEKPEQKYLEESVAEDPPALEEVPEQVRSLCMGGI